ncbi:MAG: MMPL family transporter [Actinomycetota bacterium]|nr:MMPL family transporter [Actinomycetota bacterium]
MTRRETNINASFSRLYRVGLFAFRRRWIVIGVWILIFLAAGPMLGKINDRLSQGGFEVPGSQSNHVKNVIAQQFKQQYDITDLLVVQAQSGTASDAEVKAAVAKLRTALSKGPGVAAVSDPYASPQQSISRDGRVITAVVGLTDTQDTALKHNTAMEKLVTDTAKGTPVKAYLTGAPPFYKAFQDTTISDLEKAEKIALPITLIILLVAFGTLVAAGVPLILALLALAVSFGIISFIASQTLVSSFSQNIASMIGIGVGIDYSLFLLTRYREEFRHGRSRSEAVAQAMATSGKAVLVSALTVVVALAGTQLVSIAAFKSMGFSAMIAVFVAGLAALTLLPALLGVIGGKIDSLRVRPKRSGDVSGLWHRWAMTVMRRPWRFLIASTIVLVVIALPVGSLVLGSSGPSILPADASPRVAAEIVGAAFGEGQVAPVQILVTEPGGINMSFDKVYALSRQIARDPEVVRVDSIADLVTGVPAAQAQHAYELSQASPFVARLVSPDGTRTLVQAITKHGGQSAEAQAFVERLRASIPSNVIVGGDAGLNTDINKEMGRKLFPVFGLVMLLSYLVLMLFFRSVLLPLKAILMNLAAVLATYGAMTYVFQEGHFEGLLGFKSGGHIESFLPLFLFCILFGLSMDYEVFLLARVREEYLRTRDNTEAVGWGLEHTAGIITSAAAIMVTVFGAFVAASLVPIKAMGFGLAAAVFLDATIIRIILVPATMRLMGDWNWWIPKWLDRILPRVSLEEATAAEPEPAAVV